MKKSSSERHLPHIAEPVLSRSRSVTSVPRKDPSDDRHSIVADFWISYKATSNIMASVFMEQVNNMIRADVPVLMKKEDGHIKLENFPERSNELTFKKYLPSGFQNENFPARPDDGKCKQFLEGEDLEICQRLGDFLSVATAKAFGENTHVDRLPSQKSAKKTTKESRRLQHALCEVADEVLAKEVEHLLLRESYFRKRNMSIPYLDHLKSCHFPAQQGLLFDVLSDDLEAFTRHLEEMAADSETQKTRMCEEEKQFTLGSEISYDKMFGPFHVAIELHKFEFVARFLRKNYPNLTEIAQDLVYTWLNETDSIGHIPFETALYTDFEDRFEFAALLLEFTNPARLVRPVPVYHSVISYKETPLDKVILAGNYDFSQYYLERNGLTADAKPSALLSTVCIGDVELLRYIWSFGEPVGRDVFWKSSGGSESGFCAPSPLVTAIYRKDIAMVKAILNICPEAANTIEGVDGVLPYQYAMNVEAPEDLIKPLKDSCHVRDGYMQNPMYLLHLMKVALRHGSRALFEEGFHNIIHYVDRPDFVLPEILRYAMFAKFYDVAEQILKMCIQYPNMRNNMREELTNMYILLLTDQKMPENVVFKMHEYLHENGIDMSVVNEYLKKENPAKVG